MCSYRVTSSVNGYVGLQTAGIILHETGHKYVNSTSKYMKYHIFELQKNIRRHDWLYENDSLELSMIPSWLDSSVGRALHWYRRGHGFESRSGLNFFYQALISQLLKLCA